jgi:hypothetical protein
MLEQAPYRQTDGSLAYIRVKGMNEDPQRSCGFSLHSIPIKTFRSMRFDSVALLISIFLVGAYAPDPTNPPTQKPLQKVIVT